MTLLSQYLEFAAQFIQDKGEAGASGIVRRLNFSYPTKTFNDKVNGTVVQMKTSTVCQHSHLCARLHFDFASDASGQGLLLCAATRRFSPFVDEIESSGRT